MICPHCGANSECIYLCGHIPISRDEAIADLKVLLHRIETLKSFGAGDPERDDVPKEMEKALQDNARAALILAEALGV